ASREALLAHVDETRQRFARLAELHFVIAFPMLMGMSLFDELYRDLFGNETAFDAFKLLQGQPNKTVESGRALWALSRRALALPIVRRLPAERDQAIAAARERLQGYPQPVVGQFEGLLKAAQTASVLSEDHGFWIDYSSAYEVRMVALEVGRRLVDAGALEAPEDVIHLAWD